MSTWYCCSYFQVLHVDLLPELVVAIHYMKSEGNVRSSHLACCSTSIIKRTVHPKKSKFSYKGSKSYTYIVWKKSSLLNKWVWNYMKVRKI